MLPFFGRNRPHRVPQQPKVDIAAEDPTQKAAIDQIRHIRTGMINSGLAIGPEGSLMVCGRAGQQGQVLKFDSETWKPSFLAVSNCLISQVAWMPRTDSLITALDSLDLAVLEEKETRVIRHSQLTNPWNCRANQFIVTPHYIFSPFTRNTILLYKWRKRQACFRPFVKNLDHATALNNETAYVIHEESSSLTLFSLKILKPLKTFKNGLPSLRGENKRIEITKFQTVKCLPTNDYIAVLTQTNLEYGLTLVHKSLNFSCHTVPLKLYKNYDSPTFLECLRLGNTDYVLVIYKKYLVLEIYEVVRGPQLAARLEFKGTLIQKNDHNHFPPVSAVFVQGVYLMIARSDGIVTRLTLKGLEPQHMMEESML